jgi:uncharacterized protein YggU (UPF0235/DUF167 family)
MLRLAVVAHPGARVERVRAVDDETLEVWVRARPVEGQANAAIQRAIAWALGLKPRQVEIVGGATGRRKIVDVDVPGREALQERLVAYGLRAD